MPRNLSFRVETHYAAKGGRVGIIKPDENGVYKGLAMMNLGEKTQQGTYYDPASVVEQITDPTTKFNIVLRQHKLYGEWGHPKFYGLTKDEALTRLRTVDEDRHSHLFLGVASDAPDSNGYVMIRGDIKPMGPNAHYVRETLDDPVANTAFSLRGFVDNRIMPDGTIYRTMRQLTTWDCVGASGYFGTDKAHSIGLESYGDQDSYLEYDLDIMSDGVIRIDQVALESLTDTDSNEIFGVRSIKKLTRQITLIKGDMSVMSERPDLYASSIFNDYFREIK
jgi:hypothetical protein